MVDIQIVYSLGEYQSAVDSAVEKLHKNSIIERIWAKDYTLWKQSPDEIINRLGWLEAPSETLKKTNYLRRVLTPFVGGNIKEVFLLGIGGSSLAAEVFGQIFGSRAGYPQLQVLDTTDPEIISKVSKNLDWEKTLFLISSKSGTTLEITSLFQYFYNLASCGKMGAAAGGRFIFITDEGSPLLKVAQNISAYHTFLNNQNIGGRYSALSFPGIVPAAIIGVDVERLLQRAVDTLVAEKQHAAGATLGAVLSVLAQAGRDKLSFILPPHWKSFGNWLEQLIAESTGKEGKGILPVLDEPFLDNDVYGKDRVFVIFQKEQENNSPKIDALTKAGHPIITIKINDDYDLGSQMFLWEMAIAVAGHVLSINPFIQPGVQATKNHTRRIIAQYGKTKTLPQQAPALATPECSVYGDFKGSSAVEALAGFLNQAKAGDYVCLQVFLSPSPEIDEALLKLREAIAAKYHLAVTLGYGPRYLHSTGQLHKGDSGNGLFIQLTADDLIDVDIPDRFSADDSTLTFGKLKAAQAEGDWQALIDARRRVIRFHFKTNPTAGLKNLSLNL